MDVRQAVQQIQKKFAETGSPASIPLIKGGEFTATLVEGGVKVDNLGREPFLPWVVFQEAVCAMIRGGGRAKRGDAMQSKLGDERLSTDSIEGHVAQVVFGKRPGDTVFRRITPIAAILIWANVCRPEPGALAIIERV